jgi:putative DNA primase/helicase
MTDPKDNIIRLVRDAETLDDGKGPVASGSTAPDEAKAKPADDDIDLACAWLPRTDLGNAERFLKRFGDSFLYVEQWGWLAWDGKRWNLHEADAILARKVHLTIKAIALEAKAWKESAFDFVVDKKKGENVWDSDKLKGWGLASQSAAHINCVAKLAQSHLTASPESFDVDPLAMNVDNGTLRFAKSDTDDYVTFHAHRRADRMTKITPVAFDAEAQCPLYDKFLAKVQPNADMQRHLHAWGGVSLTALLIAKLAFWYGTGRNGKSTLADIWAHVMGDYARTIPIESFLDQGRTRRGGEASPDIAALPGVRCLRTSEPEKRSKLAESLVKLVTGGEPVTARHLNRDFFEFRPAFKLTMQGNYKPQIEGTDEGMWARIMLVPWTVMIPEGERDTELPAKLRAEASGILNRLLDGLRDYLDYGLSPSDEVIEATAEYRDDSDPIGRFLKDCVFIHPAETGKKAPAHDLYHLYKAWAKSVGERRWSPKAFSRGLTDHGIMRLKSSQIYYLGIEIIKSAGEFAGVGFEEDDTDDRNRR